MNPRVVVLVLNWNGKADTLAGLESLQRVRYANFETVVIDNGSSDGTVEAVRTRFPQQKVIETGENLGFAGDGRGGHYCLRGWRRFHH